MSAALPALREALRVLYGASYDSGSRREADAFLQAFTHHDDAWAASHQLLLVGDPGEQARPALIHITQRDFGGACA